MDILDHFSDDLKIEILKDLHKIGFWTYNNKTEELKWDESMYKLYGISTDHKIRQLDDWITFIHDNDKELFQEFFNKHHLEDKQSVQFRIKHPIQIEKHIKTVAKTHLKDGELIYSGMNYDISSTVVSDDELFKTSSIFRTFIEQSPNAIAMFDNEIKYLAASDKWIDDYGINDNIIGKSHYEVFPEIGDDWKQIHQNCLKGHIDINDYAEFHRLDGKVQCLRWHVRPWRYPNDKIGGILMFSEDVTHIFEEKEHFKNLVDLLQQTQKLAKIGSWKVDLVNHTVFWDKITKEIHEVSHDFEPELEKGIQFYKEGYSRDKVTDVVNNSVKYKKPFDSQLQIVTAKGKEIWVRSIGRPEINKDGEVVAITGLFQNIDDIKRKEIENEVNRKKFETAFEYSAIGMALISIQGQWLRVNKVCSQIFGYSEDELTKMNVNDITHIDDLEKSLDLREEAIHGEEHSYQTVKRYIRKNGTAVWTSLNVSLVRDIDESPLFFVIQIEDISKRIESDKRIRQANEDLKILTDRLTLQNKSLTDFAHITSHNLRSPIANLITLQSIYNQSQDEGEKKDVLDKINSSTEILKETLEELIEALIIRDSSGGKYSEFKIFELIQKTITSFNATIKTLGAKIEIIGEKDLIIKSNKLYLESIISNLLSNALKYRKSDVIPEVIISYKMEKNNFIISVSDNGLGIDLDRHSRKLFGLRKTFHRHPEAKGVGLFIVKTQVESMGGNINVKSEPGKGTTFTITL